MTRAYSFAPAELRLQHAEDELAQILASELAGRSVLHFGAEAPFLAASLTRRGVDAFVVPLVTPSGDVQETLGLQGRVIAGPLTEPLRRRFDVIMAFGGFDSLERMALDQALDHVARATDLIVTSYRDSHIPTELRRLGFSRDFAADVSALPQGAALFRKEPVPDLQLVLGYEAALARLTADAGASAERAQDAHQDRVAALQEELLVARDAAVGAEAAAGEARAQAVELARQLDAMRNERGTRQLKLAAGIDRLIPERGWELFSTIRRAFRSGSK